MELVIDSREKYLIDHLKENGYIQRRTSPDNNEEIKGDFTVKTLDIGDIHIYLNGLLVIIIERKTISDLIASIMDGRYRNRNFGLKLNWRMEYKYTI